jgi:hypothetical protein
MKCKCKDTIEKALDDIENILNRYLMRKDTISFVNNVIPLVMDLKHKLEQHLKEGD